MRDVESIIRTVTALPEGMEDVKVEGAMAVMGNDRWNS